MALSRCSAISLPTLGTDRPSGIRSSWHSRPPRVRGCTVRPTEWVRSRSSSLQSVAFGAGHAPGPSRAVAGALLLVAARYHSPMAIVHGTLALPLDDVSVATRQVAAQQGYLLSEGVSGLGVLMFRKGVALFSWGSFLKVSLDATSASSTSLMITTGETLALTDWGRGKRAANRMLAALGAVH